MPSALKTIFGIFNITIDGTLIGSTTPAGLALSESRDMLDVESGQMLGDMAEFRKKITRLIKFTVNNFDLEGLKLLMDIAASISGSGTRTLDVAYSAVPTLYAVVITGPWESGKTMSYTTSATVREIGEMMLGHDKNAEMEVTLKERSTYSDALTTFGQFSEATSDATAPTVSSITPLDEATDVAITTSVAIVFSDALDLATVNVQNFAIIARADESVAAIGAPAWNSGSKTVTLTPSSSLANSTDYIVVVGRGVRNVAGLNLAAMYTASFTTVAA